MNKIAFIFPGQGSQQVGMGASLVKENESAAKFYREADEKLGFSLSQICFKGPDEKLQYTAITQPAILTTSVALYQAFMEKASIAPAFVAGHSLGEYTALVAAGVISFPDAVLTVHKRGKWMDEAVPAGKGAMAAVLKLEKEKLELICEAVSQEIGIVEIANYNSADQIVISGERDAVVEASKRAEAEGARKVIPLAVSGPFHSSLMQPAAQHLTAELEQVHLADGRVPLVSNVTARAVNKRDEIIRLLVDQVTSPVRFEESIQFMIDQGVTVFIEFGAGRVLTGLIKKIDRKVKTLGVYDAESIDSVIAEIGC
ncbi:ACP S-malonyltransferase [Hazenella sp. IB182357]|uniref:Malonyl CoA-acyl carrier protein transacylase n=1 Tax=Polycladospora coralii TaxID=2771432 RepID=A0A926ND58_9BACL|nr:ACP S-malonyltransferase [Polycladospora coralii]MBD1371409.1 ACP S-malonyltransferase [Polycladospora coralii]